MLRGGDLGQAVLETTCLHLEECDEGAYLLLDRFEPDERVELGLELLERERRQWLPELVCDPVDGIAAGRLAQPLADHLEAAGDIVEWVWAHSGSSMPLLLPLTWLTTLTTVASTLTEPVTVANRLRPVLLKLNRHLRREIHSLGVTGGQASLLFTIQRRPGIGVRELAELERMSAPGMSKYVTRLEQAGLVEREPSAEDRRRVGLRLTEEADRVLRSVKPPRPAWLAARLRDLSPAELEAVDAAIEPLQQLIDE